MINRRIAISGMSILAALALAGGAAFAVFTDTATSQNNTFSTGNADLQIANNVDNGENPDTPSVFGGEIAAPAINEENIIPGFNKDYKFWLKNNSSAGLNMNLAANLADIITSGNAGIADQLNVSINCGAQAGPASVSGFTGGPYSVGTLNQGQQVECTMNVSLPNSTDNNFQNSSVRFDGVFTGTQL